MSNAREQRAKTFWKKLSLSKKRNIIQLLFLVGIAISILFITFQAMNSMQSLTEDGIVENDLGAVNQFLAPVLYHEIEINRSISGLDLGHADGLKYRNMANEELTQLESMDTSSEEKGAYLIDIKKKWEDLLLLSENKNFESAAVLHEELTTLLFILRDSVSDAFTARDPTLKKLYHAQRALYQVQRELVVVARQIAKILSTEGDKELIPIQFQLDALQRSLQTLSPIKFQNQQQVNAAQASFEIGIDPLLSRMKLIARGGGNENDRDILFEVRTGLEGSFSFGAALSKAVQTELNRIRIWTALKAFSCVSLVVMVTLLGLIGFRKLVSEIMQQAESFHATLLQWNKGNFNRRIPEDTEDEIGAIYRLANHLASVQEKNQHRLLNLKKAIEELNNGNFSYRLEKDLEEKDYKEFAETYNNLAASFEEVLQQLNRLGVNLKRSATEIASTSKHQEGNIIEQESTTRQISVTASQISTTAKEFATTISDVSLLAEKTSTLASEGQVGLTNMEKIMRQMVDASTNIASKLAVLNEKAGNITSVITTIAKVSEQTNQLSLNAAIEAEKAGEFGRSFSVIAREIKRLADQTALSLLDIEKMVNEINSAVSTSVMGIDDFTQVIRNGVQQVEKVGEQLVTIIDQVQTLAKRFDKVNHGMKTQSVAAEQINEALVELSNTASSTTESMHQFRSAIENLELNAGDLKMAIIKLKREEEKKEHAPA